MFAQTTNYGKIRSAFFYHQEALQSERIIVGHGSPGLGKTAALQELAAIIPGVYYYCAPGHSPRSLCLGILDACQQTAGHVSTSELIGTVAQHLKATNKPLLLDDCDNLTTKGILLETVRAIHDLSGQVVVMVGMTQFLKKISRHPQVLDRAHIIEFTPLSLTDVQALAMSLSTIDFHPELCKRILQSSQGKHRLAVRSIGYCDRWANQHKYDTIDIEKWGNQPLLPRIETTSH